MTNLLDGSLTRVSRARSIIALGVLLFAFIGIAFAGAAVAAHARPVVTDAARITLPDGTSLVAGGRNGDGSALGIATLYGAAGNELARSPFEVPRWSTTLTVLRSGDVLMTGGMTADETTPDVQLYHLRTRSFEHVGRLRIARVAHTATVLSDGTVLIAAGERAPGKFESSTELYDPANGRFSLTADGYGRISQSAIRIDHGDVLMMGGDPGRGRKNCSIIYSATQHTYRDAGRLVHASEGRLTFELPGHIIVTHTIDRV